MKMEDRLVENEAPLSLCPCSFSMLLVLVVGLLLWVAFLSPWSIRCSVEFSGDILAVSGNTKCISAFGVEVVYVEAACR